MRYSSVIVGTALSMLFVACTTSIIPPKAPVAATSEDAVIHLVAPDGRTIAIRVEFARTADEQQRGLMGRTELASDAGMLFIFPQEQVLSFWMKNTLIPLDILFFDDAGRFDSGLAMPPCPPQTPCPLYASRGSARYALEVPAGFIRQFGAGEGWRLIPGPGAL